VVPLRREASVEVEMVSPASGRIQYTLASANVSVAGSPIETATVEPIRSRLVLHGVPFVRGAPWDTVVAVPGRGEHLEPGLAVGKASGRFDGFASDLFRATASLQWAEENSSDSDSESSGCCFG